MRSHRVKPRYAIGDRTDFLCGRCGDAAGPVTRFCKPCFEVANEVTAHLPPIGERRTFWHFDADDDYALASVEVERVSAARIYIGEGDRKFHSGYVRYWAFATAEAALRFRDRLLQSAATW